MDNYIITKNGAEFTINKRIATWTTNPASKTYGDPDSSLLTTGSGSNFVAADNVTATYSHAIRASPWASTQSRSERLLSTTTTAELHADLDTGQANDRDRM